MCTAGLAVLAASSFVQGALASAPFADLGVREARLAVNRDGEALVTYRRSDGTRRAVLVWGAVDALPPTQGSQQVAFRFDYAGGWGKHRDPTYARRFRNACGPYTGPELRYLVAACTAADATHWTLQAWPRRLPHRGHAPWKAGQADDELRISHWSGEPAKLEVWTDWAFGQAHDLFGRLTYRGAPVHGFGTTPSGVPTDAYGRSLYIDTYDSAYGSGWKRETSIVFRRPSGAFCYSFWPTRDASLPGYPDNLRPAGRGARYRITVPGPGVTPDVVWEGTAPPDFDPRNPEHVARERRMNELLLEVTAPDRFCPTQL